MKGTKNELHSFFSLPKPKTVDSHLRSSIKTRCPVPLGPILLEAILGFIDVAIKDPSRCLALDDATLNFVLPLDSFARNCLRNSHLRLLISAKHRGSPVQRHHCPRSPTNEPIAAVFGVPSPFLPCNSFLYRGPSRNPPRSKQKRRRKELPLVIDSWICTTLLCSRNLLLPTSGCRDFRLCYYRSDRTYSIFSSLSLFRGSALACCHLFAMVTSFRQITQRESCSMRLVLLWRAIFRKNRQAGSLAKIIARAKVSKETISA